MALHGCLKRACGPLAMLLIGLAGTGPAAAQPLRADAAPAPALADEVVAAGEALGRDLAGVLAYARRHSPGLAVSAAEAQAAEARIGAAGALPDPQAQLELMDVTNRMRGRDPSLLPGEVGETRYRLTQALTGWGKRGLEVQTAQAQASRAEAEHDAAWRELAATISTAWWRYAGVQREYALAQEALSAWQALAPATLAQYRAGEAAQTAVLRVQREISAQQLVLVEIEQRRQGAVAALNGMLARPAGSPLAAPMPALDNAVSPDDAFETPLPPLPALAVLVAQTRARHPLLAAEALGHRAAQLDSEAARLARNPDFGIGVTHNRPRGGGSSWDVMLEVSIPLWQAPRRAREREAALMANAAEARQQATENELLGALGQAHAAYQAGVAAQALVRDALLPQVRAARDAARAAFAAGSGDFDGVLDAERQLIDTRLTLLRTALDTRLARVDIDRIAGDTP